jgi:uncharacterized protein YkwD
LHSIRNAIAAHRDPFVSLISKLRANRAATRVSVAAIALGVVFAASQQGVSRAGPEPAAATHVSLLPANIGVGIATDHAVTLSFANPMDRASVERGLSVLPDTDLSFSWSTDGRHLSVAPARRWMTDSRYVLVVPGSVELATGRPLSRPMRLSFTTQTAPAVTAFQLRYVDPTATTAPPRKEPKQRADAVALTQPSTDLSTPPPDTADEVSARTSITIGFSAAMDTDDVARNFAITPKVKGDLSWVGNALTFTPSERLEPGARYAISLAGAHDRLGNALDGDTSFSFTTTDEAQLVKTSPKANERDVTAEQVELWFSKPASTDATGKAFRLIDLTTRTRVAGSVAWNDEETQLTFRPADALARGHAFQIALVKGAADRDGNSISMQSTTCATKAPPHPKPTATPTPRPTVRATTRPTVRTTTTVAPSSSMTTYALNQVNAARAAYGFAPVSLSGQVSAVSQAYAQEMLRTGHFSHTGLDGSTRESRLRAGGVSFGYSGENICYHSGMSVKATLDWCHAQFMAEPYPGVFNHIANILNPHYRRLGVGIASDGNRVYVVWDFVD